MSYFYFPENTFTKRVPKYIKEETYRNMEEYNVSLGDAFEWAVKDKAKENSELWFAWYYSDFRKFCPVLYDKKYMDFSKYPLKYFYDRKTKRGGKYYE